MANNLPCDDRYYDEKDEKQFSKWLKTNSSKYSHLENATKDGLILILLRMQYELEKQHARHWEAIELVNELSSVIKGNPYLAAMHRRMLNLVEAEARAVADQPFAQGRIMGAKKRQENGEKNQRNLIAAINNLFDKPEKPGWGWGNKAIVSFLMQKNLGYAESTVLQAVKREAAKHRKTRKEEQASKFLNR